MKKTLLALSIVIATVISIVLGNLTAFAKECRIVRENTLRLHIIAASDSEFDQELKLKIRDRILAEGLFLETDDIDEALRTAMKNLDEIEAVAREVISEAGADYSVSAEIETMFFEVREYGDVVMPAGRYKALRIVVGSGEGKNWWCVLFPPLCVNPASETNEILEGVSGENARPKIKFYIVEIAERLIEYFS